MNAKLERLTPEDKVYYNTAIRYIRFRIIAAPDSDETEVFVSPKGLLQLVQK